MQVFTGLYDSTDNVFGGVIAGGRHFRKWTIPAMVPATTCVAATTALTGTINFGSATLKASTTATVIMNSGVGTLKKDFGYAIFEFDAALGLSASTADTVYTTSGSVRLLAFNWIIVTQTNTETAIDGVAFSFSGITTPFQADEQLFSEGLLHQYEWISRSHVYRLLCRDRTDIVDLSHRDSD